MRELEGGGRVLLAGAAALSLCLTGLACGPNEPTAASTEKGPVSEALDGPLLAVAPTQRAAHVRATQQSAGPAYGFAARACGGARAWNSSQGFSVELADGALAIRPTGPTAGWGLGMRWAGMGRAGHIEPVPAPVGEVDMQVNRATYRRDGSVEWYVNGPLGIEQGFVLDERPAGDGDLVLEIEVTGLVPTLLADDTGVVLASSAGKARLHYTDLWAADADGRPVAAHMAVEGSTVKLTLDDEQARYPLRVDPLAWVEQQKLTASDGAASDLFGGYSNPPAADAWGNHPMALSGLPGEGADTALIGAPLGDDSAPDQGAAYLFVRSTAGWIEQQKLVADSGAADDRFGFAVSLHGDTALIGAPFDDGDYADQGSVYVFVRSADSWTKQGPAQGPTLTASDGATTDRFGYSVSLYGDTAVVGAAFADPGGSTDQGCAYVFVRSAASWVEQQKLVADDGAADDRFGGSVSLYNDSALIGGPGRASEAGSAYVFVRSAAGWEQQWSYQESQAGAKYGRAVSLYEDTAVVGAMLFDDPADDGVADIWERSNDDWVLQVRLKGETSDDWFGASVSVYENRVIIGSPGDDVDTIIDQGSAFVFVRSAASWSRQESPDPHYKYWPEAGADYDLFGADVALWGDTALISAPGDSSSQGAAYIFQWGGQVGEPCDPQAPCLSLHCVDGVCCDTECGGGDPDDCLACSEAAGAVADGTCGPRYDGAACGEPGWSCSEGTCVAPDGTPCTHASECESAHCVDDVCCASGDCTPYRCGSDGNCRQVCDSTLECADGYVCTADKQCRPPSPEESDDEGGCGCRLQRTAATSSRAAPFVLLGLGLSLVRRRRGGSPTARCGRTRRPAARRVEAGRTPSSV